MYENTSVHMEYCMYKQYSSRRQNHVIFAVGIVEYYNIIFHEILIA